jgi:hypothetical protein
VFDEPTVFQEDDAQPDRTDDYVHHGKVLVRFVRHGDDPLDDGAGIIVQAGCSSCGAEFKFAIDALDQWLAVIGKGGRLSLQQDGLRGVIPCPRCQVNLSYIIDAADIREHGDIPMSPLLLLLPEATRRIKTFAAARKEAIDRLHEKLTPWRRRPETGFYPFRGFHGGRPVDFGFSYGDVESPFPRWLFLGINRNLGILTDAITSGLRPLAPMDSHIIQHAERLDEMNRTLRSIEAKLSRIADGMSHFVERDKKNGVFGSLTDCREPTEEEIAAINKTRRERQDAKKAARKRGGSRKPS